MAELPVSECDRDRTLAKTERAIYVTLSSELGRTVSTHCYTQNVTYTYSHIGYMYMYVCVCICEILNNLGYFGLHATCKLKC
jgi:hypothetical protein